MYADHFNWITVNPDLVDQEDTLFLMGLFLPFETSFNYLFRTIWNTSVFCASFWKRIL